jgi:hypothetical protein
LPSDGTDSAVVWPRGRAERFWRAGAKRAEKESLFNVREKSNWSYPDIPNILKDNAAFNLLFFAELLGICQAGDSKVRSFSGRI